MTTPEDFLIQRLQWLCESFSDISKAHREEADAKPRQGTAETDFGRGLLVGDAIGLEHAAKRVTEVLASHAKLVAERAAREAEYEQEEAS